MKQLPTMKNLVLLQDALRRVDKHKLYRERPLKTNVIDQPQISESST